MTAQEVADALHGDEKTLEIFLNALSAMGLIRKRGNNYVNSKLASRWLSPSSPDYAGHQLVFEDRYWGLWERLEQRLLTGRPQRRPSVFRQSPQATQELLLGLHGDALGIASRLAERLPLQGASSLLDLGGGAGTYALAFCQAHPGLQATIFDLPHAIAVAHRVVEQGGMAHRIRFVQGDLNRDPLAGMYDVVFLSNVLHNFGPRQNQALMKKLFRSLHPRGSVILRDVFLNANQVAPAWPAIFSVNMMLHTPQGKCYTRNEAFGWLERAGFRDIQEWESNEIIIARKEGAYA